MQFKFEHKFLKVSLEKFVAHLNDPRLNKMLSEGLDFESRELISKQENPDDIEWKFLVKASGDFPKAIKKILKNGAISWVETSRFVPSENCVYWQIDPHDSLLKFHGEGTWQLSSIGKGCKRTIEGKITVNIPFVGKMIEGVLVNELEKMYEVEPSIQKQFYENIV